MSDDPILSKSTFGRDKNQRFESLHPSQYREDSMVIDMSKILFQFKDFKIWKTELRCDSKIICGIAYSFKLQLFPSPARNCREESLSLVR